MKLMVLRGILAALILVGCSYFLTQTFAVARVNIVNFFQILEGTVEPLMVDKKVYIMFAVFCIFTGIATGTFATE